MAIGHWVIVTGHWVNNNTLATHWSLAVVGWHWRLPSGWLVGHIGHWPCRLVGWLVIGWLAGWHWSWPLRLAAAIGWLRLAGCWSLAGTAGWVIGSLRSLLRLPGCWSLAVISWLLVTVIVGWSLAGGRWLSLLVGHYRSLAIRLVRLPVTEYWLSLPRQRLLGHWLGQPHGQ